MEMTIATSSFLKKSPPPSRLPQVLRGRLSPVWRRRIEAIADLPQAERAILDLLGRGLDNKMIAHELDISLSKLGYMLQSIRNKIGLPRERDVVVLAALWRQGATLDPRAIEQINSLTAQQRAVFEQLGKGDGNELIATTLCIAKSTLDVHIKLLKSRLNLPNTRTLIAASVFWQSIAPP